MRTLIAIMLLASPAFAADLAIPKPKHAPELCLQTGHEPYPGQMLKTDKTCPSGLRWVFQR